MWSKELNAVAAMLILRLAGAGYKLPQENRIGACGTPVRKGN
jgi:hypothetical protein